MLSKLKSIYKLNVKAFEEFKNRNIEDEKIGISANEWRKILRQNTFSEGSANFFGKKFYFSHGPSFIHSVIEIFRDEIYKFKPESNEPFIIDCGANIGLSVCYFKKHYPNSRILAFEPDKNIFELLRKNVKQFATDDKIELVESAVWTEDTELNFYSEGALAGSALTDFDNKKNIVTVSAVDLKKYLNKPVDFLKIDIEGAENTVIFDIKDQLANVKMLFLEYHAIIGNEQNLGNILNLLRDAGFEYYIKMAYETISLPFYNNTPHNYQQQLNIFCYRK